MECHVFYELIKEYPTEETIYICNLSMCPFIIISGGIVLSVSYVILLCEIFLNNFSFSTNIITFSNDQYKYNYTRNLLVINPITAITYYCSVTQFIINVIVPMVYFYNLYFKIFRKNHYFKQTLPHLSFNIISMFYPQVIYYYAINDVQSYFDATTLANMFIIFWWIFFYHEQKIIIKNMNTLNNEIIKNYDYNDII